MYEPGDKVKRIHEATFGDTRQGDVVTVKRMTSIGNMTIEDEQPERIHDPDSYELVERWADSHKICLCDDCSGDPCYLIIPTVVAEPSRCPFGARKPRWRQKND